MSDKFLILYEELTKEELEIEKELERMVEEYNENIKRKNQLFCRRRIGIFSYETENKGFYTLTCLKDLCAFISKADETCYAIPNRLFKSVKNAMIRKFAKRHGAKIQWENIEIL